MLSLNRKLSGFTLVELLIVLTIFSVLAAFALPSYRQMIENNKIRSAAESIHNGIQIARAEAVKRNVPVQFDLRGTHSAWTVCVSPAVAGACPNPDDAVATVQSRSLGEGSSSDVSVVISDASPLVFNSLGVLTSPVPTAANGLVSLDIDNAALSSSDSRNLRVVIGAGGSVKMCDPALNSGGTDPRKCP
ncbi:MAG TPA: type II secretion system protein GspH [Methylophilaceae bacterium]|nr:type II secretion system protein GspH [Methylophilaceae bacterium]HAJ72253.1 type II secretion system protein GspH [Methylophilaceae bacterium]